RREAFDLSQKEDESILLGQSVDRHLDEVVNLATGCGLLGIGSGLDLFDLRRFLLRGSPKDATTPSPRQCLAQRDLRDPARESSTSGELTEAIEGAHPGFLRDLFRLSVIAQNRPRRAIDALVISAQQNLEEFDVSIANSFDDLFVGEVPCLERAAII